MSRDATGVYTGASDQRVCHGQSTFKLTTLRKLEATYSTVHTSTNELQRHDETQHSKTSTCRSLGFVMYIPHLRWAQNSAQYLEKIRNHQKSRLRGPRMSSDFRVYALTDHFSLSDAVWESARHTIRIGGRAVPDGTRVRRHILTCRSP
jgi:hypothetical protein